MYRHLLVPIDGTDLSTETVGKAVELARSLGARITFFHAMPDHAASLFGEAELVRVASPAGFAYAYEGRARELLTKAEAAARAQGVPCASASAVSDSPYRAIVSAARDGGCDLIFMASHGRRSSVGMMLGSQTLKVLVHAEIPVLVSATSNPSQAVRAIGIILDEHRSLAAVLHAWQHLLDNAEQLQAQPSPALLQAIVRYIQSFPVALHHPKEELLFELLRAHTSEANAELDELERQHPRDREMVAELATMVQKYTEQQLPVGELRGAVSRYAAFIWDHLGREEGVILPAAQRHLSDADWQKVETAFGENRDPCFGADSAAQFRQLFSRIVNLAPSAAEAPVRGG
jgi:nucleotide-binding universal stress UspA family protein/hemerythrin-like domain-containing protein